MSDDLVKRLRNEKMGCNLWCEYYDGITTIPLCIEAADHIEKLERENNDIIIHFDGLVARIEKLEAALIDILKVPRSEASWGIALVIARHALKEGKDE